MGQPQKIWQIAEVDTQLAHEFTTSLGVSETVARILCNRGLKSVAEVREFLACELQGVPDPFLLKGMDRAVKRILQGIEAGEKIMVYGDYDVDGVTSTALLLDTLEILGADADFYIPDRHDEGYGLNQEAISKIFAAGYTLVISVDCGISAVAEAEFAAKIGLELIITDHHEPPENLPVAFAVINPKQAKCPYPFKDLAGVGVAFKLAQALFHVGLGSMQAAMELLDLFTLGTIADMVPLQGENRTLVKHGLISLGQTDRIGIRALLEVAGLQDKEIGAGQVGFGLAPRINATGRIGDASLAVQLMRTDDELRARDMAAYLDSENQARQEIEANILAEALQMLQEFDSDADRVIVLASANWHAGVIGIVASRLVEKFYRPVLLIAIEGSDGKGSARSVPGFNLHAALTTCSDLLLKFGGHKQAAGLSLAIDNIAPLRKRLNELACLEDAQIFIPKLKIDARISLAEVTKDLVDEIQALGPFGIGNAGPVLMADKLDLLDARTVGRDKTHLKVRLQDGNRRMDGIGFNLAAYLESMDMARQVEVAFVPDLNDYNGKVSVQLQLKDLRNFNLASNSSKFYHFGSDQSELMLQEQLNHGKSVDASATRDIWLPIKAAMHRAEVTGRPAVLVYPVPSLVHWIAVNCREALGDSDLPLTTILERGDCERITVSKGINCVTSEFLPQVLVKLKEQQTVPALLAVDSLEVTALTISEESHFPILRTQTAAKILDAQAPARDRLARLYTVLRSLADATGSLGSSPQGGLAECLGETLAFVQTGLDIFEELNIIKRENSETRRTIHFQAPIGKLDLTSSRRFAAGLIMAEEMAQLKQIG
ncbi:MAG: single-stranded-DNA-specific exonuclease RecJ [Peptococcaceae bacterium]|nr:single-stranded-DNA-specific exonuclease RecJ [Peptococcaceae bacterium]